MESILILEEKNRACGLNETFDLFEQTLGNNQRFLIYQSEPLSLGRIFTVDFKDYSQRTLLTIKMISGGYAPYAHREYVIQITNTSGQLLFTAKALSLEELTVWSTGGDGQYLGKLKLSSGCCSAVLYAKTAKDELLFHMGSSLGRFCGERPSELSLIVQGDTVARIQRLNNESANVEVSLLNSRNCDKQTKFFLILAGWQLYVLYFAELSSGRIGAAQHGKCCTYFVIAVLVISVFVSIIGLIFVIR